MKHGQIFAVDYLRQNTDEARIAEARELFRLKGAKHGADGFEVWDGARFVYRFPESAQKQRHSAD